MAHLKTSWCRYVKSGRDCPHGERCTYAHSNDELFTRSDLKYYLHKCHKRKRLIKQLKADLYRLSKENDSLLDDNDHLYEKNKDLLYQLKSNRAASSRDLVTIRSSSAPAKNGHEFRSLNQVCHSSSQAYYPPNQLFHSSSQVWETYIPMPLPNQRSYVDFDRVSEVVDSQTRANQFINSIKDSK